uniref:Uncharacterized protein n=1 Tax=Anopheles dirus TaxID=7168 RepID=A0A182NCM7_9DIPT
MVHTAENSNEFTLEFNQIHEGGAMYISCGSTDSTPMEPETGYVPNNPLFGMPLDSPQECPSSCGGSGCSSCQENAASLPLAGLHGSDFSDCGNCLDHSGVLSSQSNLSSYWSEDMTSYKPERPTHDVADVLLSLKHAVLKQSPDPSPIGQGQNFATPQASLSYTVHPQMLLSPASHHGHGTHAHYNQMQSQAGAGPYGTNYYDSSCAQHSAPPMYPSMSVNVSMNMTMHGYGAEASVPMQCSQMQWGAQNAASSVNVLYPPLLSPSVSAVSPNDCTPPKSTTPPDFGPTGEQTSTAPSAAASSAVAVAASVGFAAALKMKAESRSLGLGFADSVLSYFEEYHHFQQQQQRSKYEDNLALFGRNNFVNIF